MFVAVLIVVGVSWVYWGVAAWSVVRHMRRNKDRSSGATGGLSASASAAEDRTGSKLPVAPIRQAAYVPLVSILKPVKGDDAHAYENFLSFCEQDYSDFEILFAVADVADPAIPLIHRLREEFPQRRIRLLAGGEEMGANPKASLLHRLACHARGQVLVISDSDIRVERDYLRRVVEPLRDPDIGVVTCPYRGEQAENWVSRLAALHMGTIFLPSATVAHRLFHQRLGLGATIAVRHRDLEQIGGVASFADYLADDYQLAGRIASLGLKICLSDVVVSSVLGRQQFSDQWRREVRWARTIRTSCPTRYPGLLLTFSTPLALLAAMNPRWWPAAGAVLAGSLGLRWLVSWIILRAIGQHPGWRDMLLLPVRDVLSAIVWCAGLLGRHVTWRGRRFFLTRDGRLSPMPLSQEMHDVISRFVRWIDATLRRRQGVFEYSNHPDCILRVSVAAADEDVALADGVRIRQGDQIAELHLWNERVPPMDRGGPTLRWAATMSRHFGQSLAEFARAIENDPRLKQVRAIHGRSIFVPRGGDRQISRIAARYGLELVPSRRPTFREKFHDFFENFLLLGLVWTFNRNAVRSARLLRQRRQFWISRQALLARYAPVEV